jgi:hypothetical protein
MKSEWLKNKFHHFLRRLMKDYRLSIYDNSNLTEVYTSTVSKLSIWVILLFISLISVSITLILLFYTPLKRSIPGYPSKHMSEMIHYNSIMVDSLQNEITIRDNYLEKIQKVIMGGVVEDTVKNTEIKNEKVEMKPMKDDAIFEKLIEPENNKEVSGRRETSVMSLSELKFFPPVKGTVSNKFRNSPGYYGIDILGFKNSKIAAVLDGTVIFAEWSISTGYVVEIQHDNNLVSIYKYNSDVKVKQGDKVKAGDIIAIMGSEGKHSNEPYLHFELWQEGKPVNVEQYIKF